MDPIAHAKEKRYVIGRTLVQVPVPRLFAVLRAYFVEGGWLEVPWCTDHII